MSLLGNILWVLSGSFLAALGYWLCGFLLCLTVLGIPFGLQAIHMGSAVLAPFGKSVQPSTRLIGPFKILFDMVWLIFFGWEIAMTHLLSAGVCALTVIGIPFAIQHLKLIPVALLPFSYELAEDNNDSG